MTCANPVMSRTVRSNTANDRAPAYDSSPFIIPDHWYTDMAPVPESVSRSMRTSSAWSRKHVVMRRLERRRAVCVRCLANRLDGLDAERLDDRLELHEAVTD